MILSIVIIFDLCSLEKSKYLFLDWTYVGPIVTGRPSGARKHRSRTALAVDYKSSLHSDIELGPFQS